MKKYSIILLAIGLLSSVASVANANPLDWVKQQFNSKRVSIGIAVDMTASSKADSTYAKAAERLVQSTLRQATTGDIVTIYRVCSYAETVATIVMKERIMNDTDLKRYGKAAIVSCTDKGTATTEALEKMDSNNHNVIMFFTDGGISDDPRQDKKSKLPNFGQVAQTLISKKAVLFAGLSQTKRLNNGNWQAMRDSVINSLPKKSTILTAGMVDENNNFNRFSDLVRAARR